VASVSVSQLILFIAAMLVAASVAGLLTSTVNDIGDAIEDQGLATSDDIRSDITIINDAGATEKTSGNVTLYVKNTGNSDLSTQPEDIDILINGEFVTGISSGRITLLDGAEIWSEGDVLEIVVDITSVDINDPGENRAQVTVGGAEDVFIWEQ
jgi:flagellar protein FlaG